MTKLLDIIGVTTLWQTFKTLLAPSSKFLSQFPTMFYTVNPDDNTIGDTNILLAFKTYQIDKTTGAVTDLGINQEIAIPAATTTHAGLLSKADKTKLDSITAADIANIQAISSKIADGYTLIAVKN